MRITDMRGCHLARLFVKVNRNTHSVQMDHGVNHDRVDMKMIYSVH
jgi:hypothetical protein